MRKSTAFDKGPVDERDDIMTKKAVIFDMDGLMFDTQSVYDSAYRETALKEFGTELSDKFCEALMGSCGDDMLRTVNEFYPQMDAYTFIRHSFALTAQKVRTELRAMPSLGELLEYLRETGYILAVASASESPIVQNNLLSSGLGHYFAACLCGDEVVHGKPHPEMYLRAAEMISCDPQECYVLEDSPNGILAASRAGCTPVMVPDVVQPDEEIRRLCAGVFGSLLEVRDAMKGGKI